MTLPDFIRLTKDEREREVERQAQARRDFNSRAQQSPAADALVRASIIEDSLRDALRQATNPAEIKRISAQLAENVAAQGRFTEAAQFPSDEQDAYKAIAAAVFDETGCSCNPEYARVSGKTIKLPKYSAVREIYSLRAGRFGFLLRCNTCGVLIFSDTNLAAPGVTEPTNDLDLLRV